MQPAASIGAAAWREGRTANAGNSTKTAHSQTPTRAGSSRPREPHNGDPVRITGFTVATLLRFWEWRQDCKSLVSVPLSLALVFANLNGPVALELKARRNWLLRILVIAVRVVIVT